MRRPRRLPALPLPRRLLAAVAVVAHLFAATGSPVPSAQVTQAGRSPAVPYPCQDHPCGCVTAEACWAGDCCCYTLEQKLAWAEGRGIDPPVHVRPAVEARKARAIPPKPKKKPCCSEAAEPAVPTAPSCCDQECRDEQKPAARPAPGIRWVASVFAQKCRGEGPAGLLQLDPAVAPVPHLVRPATAEPAGLVRASSARAASAPHRPPVPPPRLG